LRSPRQLAGQLLRVRDRRVLDEHVEAAKLVADARRRGGDRSLIRHVELERMGVSLDRPGRVLPARQIARTRQDSEVFRSQILCDLKADPLVGPRDQGDRFVLHGRLPCSIDLLPAPPGCTILTKAERHSVLIRNDVPFSK
jgi:hypothetical protein